MQNYLDIVEADRNDPTKPLPGREAEMTKTHDGMAVFAVDDFTRLERFLVLGSENPTYYVNQKAHTIENLNAVTRAIAADGLRAVQMIVDVSDGGRAPKNDPAILALAYAAKKGNDATRRAALAALPKVCRIGTHLYKFVAAAETIGDDGWSRGMRDAIGRWYTDRTLPSLALELTKYAQRDGWSHRDLLRLAHVKGKVSGQRELFQYAVKGPEGIRVNDYNEDIAQAFEYLSAVVRVKNGGVNVPTAVQMIRDYRLPREVLATEYLAKSEIWEALLVDMPITATLRNLGNLAKVGLLDVGSLGAKMVMSRITDPEVLRKGRVHPVSILMAMYVYKSGHGLKGDGTWKPNIKVVDALDAAFYAAFKAVVPTGKRYMLAYDISGSMTWHDISGIPGFTPRVAGAVMGLVTMAAEDAVHPVAFTASTGWTRVALTPLNISARQRVDDVMGTIGAMNAGPTDCSAPMEYAIEHKIPVDLFVVYTDSETNSNKRQPVVALKDYRQKMGIPAKLVVVAMESNGFSIADPKDGGMLDVAGMDADVPAVIADFTRH